MTRRILSGALVAGLLAGLVAALLQLATLVPLILEAEVFETAAGAAPGQLHAEAAEPAVPVAVPVADGSGGGTLWRAFGTVSMTLVSYSGFGLLLGAGMALAARAGVAPSARTGLMWGLAGFAAVHLAPAVGLAPELPGAQAAALQARQAWWILCVAATAAGLGCLAFGRGWPVLAGGVALILLPQLVGAPQAPTEAGLVPPGLAAAFVARSLGVAAVGWALLGTIAGALAAVPPPALRARAA